MLQNNQTVRSYDGHNFGKLINSPPTCIQLGCVQHRSGKVRLRSATTLNDT